jgi:hypothetical protein
VPVRRLPNPGQPWHGREMPTTKANTKNATQSTLPCLSHLRGGHYTIRPSSVPPPSYRRVPRRVPQTGQNEPPAGKRTPWHRMPTIRNENTLPAAPTLLYPHALTGPVIASLPYPSLRSTPADHSMEHPTMRPPASIDQHTCDRPTTSHSTT